MRIPKMQASPQYRVTVPALDGGVNLKEAPNLVGDNQLTDARNVWWKDQALRTRPGLLTDEGRRASIRRCRLRKAATHIPISLSFTKMREAVKPVIL